MNSLSLTKTETSSVPVNPLSSVTVNWNVYCPLTRSVSCKMDFTSLLFTTDCLEMKIIECNDNNF